MGMMIKLGTAAIAATIGLAASLTQANADYMPTGNRTTQPVGHYDFCKQLPDECRKQPGAGQKPIELTRSLWSLMIEINNQVNAEIVPLTDMEIWGVEERWSYPVNGVGDCEDYVLEKRRRLAKHGVPRKDMLITVVRQPNGDGHAVLTIRTSMGDFVLDNLEPRILAWSETEYSYLKRQSEKHAGVWVSIEDDRAIAVGSVDRR